MNTNVKTFMDLTAQECESVSSAVKNNAEVHYRIASLLSQEKQYGNAISHLILSTEEQIKALVLFLDSKGFEIRRVEGVSKLFRQHVPRHKLLKEIFTVWLVIKPFFVKETGRGGKKKEYNDKITKFLSGVVDVMLLFAGGITGLDNYSWWKRADQLKQKGFYVDFQDHLLTPSSFTQSDYQTALQKVNSVREELSRLVAYVSSLNEKQLKSLRKLLDESKLKEQVKESIKRKL